MKKFNYPLNHKADEAYMAKMCHEGWGAVRLVEGMWTFEPCKPDQYVYRVGYLRGKTEEEVEDWKKELAAQEIQFVSRYSFWAIFRSTREFQLYTPEEEKALCLKIREPMLFGAVGSWILFFLAILLMQKVSGCFVLLAVPAFLYGGMCTALRISYTNLIKQLK